MIENTLHFLTLRNINQNDDGTTYEVINKQTKVPVQTLLGLIIDLEELFERLID